MDLRTDLAQTKRNLTHSPNRKISYIVIHYTDGAGTAKENCQYFANNDLQASADYFVDKDGKIWQFNGDVANFYSWHCGDGKGENGICNKNSIGIECVSKGEAFTNDQKDAMRALIKVLKKLYSIKNENVVRHYDASGKICPAPYCGSSQKNKAWKTLWKYMTGSWSKNEKGWWFEYGDGTYPRKSWIYVDGKWYYAKDSGYLATNEWRTIDGKRYCFDSSGAMKTGWIKTWAFCEKDGSAAVSKTIDIDGTPHMFDSWGVWMEGIGR